MNAQCSILYQKFNSSPPEVGEHHKNRELLGSQTTQKVWEEMILRGLPAEDLVVVGNQKVKRMPLPATSMSTLMIPLGDSNN